MTTIYHLVEEGGEEFAGLGHNEISYSSQTAL